MLDGRLADYPIVGFPFVHMWPFARREGGISLGCWHRPIGWAGGIPLTSLRKSEQMGGYVYAVFLNIDTFSCRPTGVDVS